VPVEAVILDPKVTAPRMVGMLAVEIVAVLADSVPIVAVPVDTVIFDPKVIAPSWRGMVAVLIVAVLADRVPIVAVPVEAVKLVPNVARPEANSVPIVDVPVDAVMVDPKVTGPKRRLLLETVNDPVLCTASIPTERAEDVLSPSVITSTAPAEGKPPVPKVFNSWG
jgi:hypothetical protein